MNQMMVLPKQWWKNKRTKKIRQGFYKLTDSINRGNDDIMCKRHKRKQMHRSIRYGTFLHNNMNDNVHMLLKGTHAQMITRLDHKIFRKYIWCNKQGKPMLYYCLKSSFQETSSSLLLWKLFSEILQEWGFTLNPYDTFRTAKLVRQNNKLNSMNIKSSLIQECSSTEYSFVDNTQVVTFRTAKLVKNMIAGRKMNRQFE